MIELGRQFGLYSIAEVISTTGGFVSCLAQDPFFNRQVILKIFSCQGEKGEAILAPLEKQLEILAELDHPSIAPIYDFGLEETDIYFTSSPYYGGSLLEQMQGRMPAERVLKLAAELAMAFDYAHEHGLKQGKLLAEKIFFDAEGRAVLTDFSLDRFIKSFNAAAESGDKTEEQGDVAETLFSLGELLLHLRLGPTCDFTDGRIEDLVAEISEPQLRKLIGRFLLPGEWRFSSFADLLDELANFAELTSLVRERTLSKQRGESSGDALAEGLELNDAEHREQAVVEIRRLVAEKNGLQQSLEEAVSRRDLAENKLLEEARELKAAQAELSKVQEEADVAWELVAAQKNSRWQPTGWAAGGFVLGLLLTGGLGYYLNDQPRTQLLAELPLSEVPNPAHKPPAEVSGVAQNDSEARELSPTDSDSVEVAEAETQLQEPPAEVLAQQQDQTREPLRSGTNFALVAEAEAAYEVAPAEEKPPSWWPAGNEFSAAAAIPLEQIKVALDIEQQASRSALPMDMQRELTTAIKSWAASWSNQDLQNYFSHYSDDYQPELGRSRTEWQEMRIARLSKPQWIKLELEDIRLRQLDKDRVEVKLKQSYRSDRYADRILKSLNLVKENGQWRILLERSLGKLSG